MERSEPALVPEWLRCSGSVTGGSSSAHHVASSSLHTDFSSSARSRSFRSISEKDSPRSAFLDRSSSSTSRRPTSSNGSTKHPYSSFTRNHRDRNREKEKERLAVGDLWDHDASDPLGSLLTSRAERNALRRSQSMVSRKPGEVLQRRTEDARNVVSSESSNLIGTQKSVFEKDFPSLGTEGKQGTPSIARVPSPGLSSAVSLPIGSSALLGSEKWTSALAEVPAVIGTNSITNSSVQQNAVATPVSAVSSSNSGLNMAEALSQAPPRVRPALQVPDKTQRLEELAIKQSRQLIPMVPNSLDKSKQLRPAPRTGEMILTPKSVQQQGYSSQLANQSRGGQVKSDASNTSHIGKFLVLKPARENGVSSAKDASTQPNNSSGQVSNCQAPAAPPTPTALMSSSKPKVSAIENKTAALSLNPRSNVEKRSSLSQAQSRNDFFNLMRKKSLNNTSHVLSDSSPAVSSPKLEKSGEVIKELDSFPSSPCVAENGSRMSSNGDVHDTQDNAKGFQDDGDGNLYLNGAIYPDEEEAAFLRSLGWEENAGEDEGLTEEEINAFYQEYMKSRPSLKVWRGTRPKFLRSELHACNSGDASSESSSSGSGYEA